MPEQAATKTHAGENPLAVLLFNIVLPVLILHRFSAENRLGPMGALGAALIFPLGFGIYDFTFRRKANPISILGFVSILTTGSFGLMRLDAHWYAVKEAAIPTLMGLVVLFSLRTKTPLVRTLLYNDKLIDVSRVDAELASRGNTEPFERLLVTTTWVMSASFLISAGMNFTLARYLVTSQAGSVEFNEQLSHMTAISYPAVVVPCTLVTMFALWRLLAGIKRLTGLDMDTIFKSAPEPKKSASAK